MSSVFMERLAAHSTPGRLAIENDDRREQRNWVIRLAGQLPPDWDAVDASAQLRSGADAAVRGALVARGLAVHGSEQAPGVDIHIVDPLHLVVTVATTKLEEDQAHDYLVAASAALRILHRLVPIDDIQGIPRRYWRLLVGE